MEEKFDYIICGAGLAGLSLAIRLADPVFEDKKILILDKSKKQVNDRTWSFWTKQNDNRFDSIYKKSWEKLAFFAPDFECIDTPGPYTYHTISGLEFYKYALDIVHQSPHISFIQTDIEKVDDLGSFVAVHTSGGSYRASYIFDSIVRNFPEDHELFVWQHFLGWEVRLNQGSFDPDTAIFMDFRIEQKDNTRFVYVLPFDDKTALVEATIFSREILKESDYENILRPYLSKYISSDYSIIHKELGAIPMTTASFSKGSKRVIPIGTNNSTVKPSSGYAFTRIQRESDLVLKSVLKGRPRRVKSKPRFLAYDRTLLNVLITKKESGRSVFSMLFKNNKMERILKFLDENTSITEEIGIFRTLPFWSFLRGFLKENVFSGSKPTSVSNS